MVLLTVHQHIAGPGPVNSIFSPLFKTFCDVEVVSGSSPVQTVLVGPSSDQCFCTRVSQVKQLVDEELFARYDRLLLQTTLDLMADVVYCPRKSCGTAVMVEPDRTMGICSVCQYAFCTLCKLGYHGLSKCKLRAGNVCLLSSSFSSRRSG